MNIQTTLQHPDAIRFSENRFYQENWETSGAQAKRLPSGHHVVYGNHGQRIFMADPSGHPLHECLWATSAHGLPQLLFSRIRLDWNQWVGIKPGGLVNTISLDLSKKPGWENLTRDDLREMAARAMNADLETIQFFYRDEDLTLHADGKVTIRQVKDAFYVLADHTFETARFMSCMSRMEWGRIDYLPVVELFLSLLPGTGNATFELIRGLYDDQQAHAPHELHYRGIPAYPSPGAFHLFRTFFSPSVQGSESPQEVFLDVNRSHEVAWRSRSDCPMRYMDEEQRLGVTVHHGKIHKVTCWDDSAGLSYFPTHSSGEAQADGRGAKVVGQDLHLYDGGQRQILQARDSWNIFPDDRKSAWESSLPSWRECFPQGPPKLSSLQAFSAVLLYPDDSQIIGEKESQPFIFDYVDDFLEEHAELRHLREMAEHILVAGCEAGLRACLKYGQPQRYTIWYEWPEFAQKHAQHIWNTLNRKLTLEWLLNFQFFPIEEQAIFQKYTPFDWMNAWIPFSVYDDESQLRQWSWFIANHLLPGGIACVAGPEIFGHLLQEQGFSVIHAEQGESLPTFKVHQAILQNSQLHPDLVIWIIQQS